MINTVNHNKSNLGSFCLSGKSKRFSVLTSDTCLYKAIGILINTHAGDKHLKIPSNNYTLESFMQYIVDNMEEVFGGRQERKWLKAYLIYVRKDWKTIFNGLDSETFGDITRISFASARNIESHDFSADYYIYQESILSLSCLFQLPHLLFFLLSIRPTILLFVASNPSVLRFSVNIGIKSKILQHCFSSDKQ